MDATEQQDQQQGRAQVGRHRGGGEQTGHRERPEPALEHHQQQGQARRPGQPAGQPGAPPPGQGEEHQQGYPHQEGIKPVEPLQEHLQVHAPARQEGSITKRPVGTGQPCLHHTGGPTDHHQGHQGDHQMGGEQPQPCLQTRGALAGKDLNETRGRQRHCRRCNRGLKLASLCR